MKRLLAITLLISAATAYADSTDYYHAQEAKIYAEQARINAEISNRYQQQQLQDRAEFNARSQRFFDSQPHDSDTMRIQFNNGSFLEHRQYQ